jgi:hypothetical protein
MEAKSITVCCTDILLATVDWTELLLMEFGVATLFS